MKKNFIPANMPGCQMMSNLDYIPAQPEMYRCQLNYIPVSSSVGAGPSGITADKRSYIPSKLGQIGENYIPASNSAFPGTNPSGKPNFKLSWWEKDSFFQYPAILISAFYGMKWADNFREHFNIPDDFIIMGDSGGFQNFTQNADLNPIDVLRWQEKHCQIGLTFDYPIDSNDSQKTIIDKQQKTVDNAYLALINRKNEKLKIYAVFQGHTYEDLNRMLNMYKSKGDMTKFDGFTIGGLVPISTNMELLSNILCIFTELLKEYKKPLHFLGVSGINIIPFILMLQKKYNIPITFDSSSYGSGAIRKSYYIDYGKYKLNFGDENTTTIHTLPCNCPICQNASVKEFKKSGSISGGLISLHNLYQILEYNKLISSLINDEPILKDYIKKFGDKKTIMALEKIDYLIENGLKKMMEKYDISSTSNKSYRTTNLFGF